MPLRLPALKPATPEGLALAGLWTSLLDLGVAALAVLVFVNAWAPAQDLPWKAFRLDRSVGMATPLQFARAAGDPALCRKALVEGGVSFAEEPARARGDCATLNTVRLRGGMIPLSPAGPVVTCPVALGYAAWTRHVVQPAARELLGGPVTGISHYGSFACRNVYGRKDGARSQHAFANAIDVAGFRTTTGREVTVARDFRREDARGQFARRVRTGACGWFRTVLSPDYNAAHRDHLHLDFGRWGQCR